MKTLLALIMICSAMPLWAQVGVNTDNPDQALDVNGKVKIADDQTTPTEGTMRYAAEGDFEGYTSAGWQSLTKSSSTIVPGTATPITAFATISPGVTQDVTLYDAFTLTGYSSVPSGKYFMVTSLIITSNNLNTTGNHILMIGPRVSTTYPISYRSIDLKGNRATGSQQIFDPSGLLAIIRPGEKFSIHNSASSDYVVDITIRGYLLEPK